jgi:hypothetical protein
VEKGGCAARQWRLRRKTVAALPQGRAVVELAGERDLTKRWIEIIV